MLIDKTKKESASGSASAPCPSDRFQLLPTDLPFLAVLRIFKKEMNELQFQKLKLLIIRNITL